MFPWSKKHKVFKDPSEVYFSVSIGVTLWSPEAVDVCFHKSLQKKKKTFLFFISYRSWSMRIWVYLHIRSSRNSMNSVSSLSVHPVWWGRGIFEPVKANKTAACKMSLPEELSSSLFLLSKLHPVQLSSPDLSASLCTALLPAHVRLLVTVWLLLSALQMSRWHLRHLAQRWRLWRFHENKLQLMVLKLQCFLCC